MDSDMVFPLWRAAFGESGARREFITRGRMASGTGGDAGKKD
jgi:hypothetical protein